MKNRLTYVLFQPILQDPEEILTDGYERLS